MAILKLGYNALWESICKWSRKAGRAATRPVLLMWYVMRSKDTPRKDKWAIFGSLAYLVLPIDILDADPGLDAPEHRAMKAELSLLFKRPVDLSRIS